MLWMLLAACDSGPSYGVYTSAIRGYQERMQSTPCDHELVGTLATTLAEAGDKPAGLSVFQTYEKNCPVEKSVRIKHFEMVRSAGLNDQAIAVAQLLQEGDPNSYYTQELAELMVASGRAEEAVPLLRAKMAGQTKKSTALVELAEAQESAGQFCEAWSSWTVVWWKSSELRGKAGTATARLMQEHPECSGSQLAVAGKVKQDPSEGYWRFETQMGDETLWLGLDTTAAYSYVTSETLAQAEGVSLVQENLSMKTGTGTLEGALYQVDKIQLGDTPIEHVQVLVVPRMVSGMDGFIGLDLSARMRMREESEKLWLIEPI